MAFGASLNNTHMFNWREDTHKVYVNLDSRPDRRKRMDAELKRVGIEGVSRMRGMLPEEFEGDKDSIQTMLNRTRGAVGCYVSQINIIAQAYELGKSAMVMEDDLVFASDITKRLDYIQDFLNVEDDWDIMWLGATFHVNLPEWHDIGHKRVTEKLNCDCTLGKDAELTDYPRILRTYGCWSTYAYIVNYKSIPKILAMLNECVSESIGIDFSFIKLQPKLKTYAFVAGSVKQYDNMSNIGDGVTHFSHYSKLGAYWFSDKIEDFDPNTFVWNEAVQGYRPTGAEVRHDPVVREQLKEEISEELFNKIFDGLQQKAFEPTEFKGVCKKAANEVINLVENRLIGKA